MSISHMYGYPPPDNQKKRMWGVLVIIFSVIIGLLIYRAVYAQVKPTNGIIYIPEVVKTREKLVVEEITRAAMEYGVNPKAALEIAQCESQYKPNAVNPKSGTKGVYQFMDKTWQYIKAPGHPFDFKENIRQFMIWYPIHPEWWECKIKTV